MEENPASGPELTRLACLQERMGLLRERIASVIVGQQHTVDLLLTAILADGHVLLEGVPGVAKTLMAKLVSRLIEADFSRIQFTPDLMPSDVLGTSVLNMKTSEFEFHRGPVFANIVLATQNPVEQEGTYKLPEAQLDRFLMKITIDYPSAEEELEILTRHQQRRDFLKLDAVGPVLSCAEVTELRRCAADIYVEDSLLKYIVQIVQQTRQSKAVYLGASPRATVGLLRAAKAYALLQGRDFVTPDDVKLVAPCVLQHRIILTAEAEMEGRTPVKVVRRLIDKVEVPQ